MKVNLKNILGLAALGMALLANGVPAQAGLVYSQRVYITWNATYAYASGTMVGARYSTDNRQFIGCQMSARPNVSPSVVCSALNSAGTRLSCVSDNARHVYSVQRMTDSSLIVFEMNRGNAACQGIRIFNESRNLQ